MVRAIMYHVAALAKAFEITQPIIARVMIEVRRRQDDAGSPHLRRLLDPCGTSGWSPLPSGASLQGRLEAAEIYFKLRTKTLRRLGKICHKAERF
jgi:hypothetical protein